MRAYASTVLNASADEVWAAIRDFGALSGWHPGVTESRIEEGHAPDRVGCIRHLTLGDGAVIRERLLHLSDVERSYSYNFETTPFAVQNYHATIRVTPVTDGGRSFVEWWTTFDCPPERTEEWVKTFAGAVFKSGLDALKKRFGG
jgi:Polyketide cyclase / dehydrase and lipid transport